MEISVNFLALLLAGVASMGIGFAWYSKMLFGKPWMKEMGFTEKQLKTEQAKMAPLFALSFVAALVMAFVLTHVTTMSVAVFNYDPTMAGISTGFWMWLGFVAPVQLTDVVFGKRSWQLFGINTSYQLVSLLTMGAIIGYLG